MDAKTKKILKWIGLAVFSFVFFSILAGIWIAIIVMLMIGLREYGHILAAKYVGDETRGFWFLPIGGISLIDINQPEHSRGAYSWLARVCEPCGGGFCSLYLFANSLKEVFP